MHFCQKKLPKRKWNIHTFFPEEDSMGRKRSCLSVLVCILACAPLSTFAWDGQRQGFLLGIGAGLGFTYTDAERVRIFTEYDTISAFSGSIGTDVKIGYAPSNQFQVCLSMKGSSLFPLLASYGKKYAESWKLKTIGDFAFAFFSPFFFPIFTSHLFTGIEGRYYLNPQVPSLFFNAGIGQSLFGGSGGTGLTAGLGYEFKRHRSVTFDMIYGTGKVETGSASSPINAFSAILTINVLGY
jgi:hypothetical protein